jgi:isoleucyl-tRNA synthetase
MKYDAKQIEKEVQAYWKKEKIPEKIVAFGDKRKKFYLLDGPPYVNGVPHVGHVKTTAFKDIWGKFKFMQGYSVWFQPGFDCGGLPIENKVEELLNVKRKTDIVNKIGVDKFIEECKKFAKGNEPVWLNLYKNLGAWRGWVEPYLTSENYYIESGWWTVKKLYEKGLLVKGEKPGFWCPKCETVLAGYEVSDSYKDVEDPSIFIKFKVKDRDEHLLAWTTTPWTLNANVALVVHPDETYVKADVNGEKLVLAKERLVVLEELEIGYKILEEFPGKNLEGLKYEPLIECEVQEELVKDDRAHRVYLSIPLLKQRASGKVAAKKKTETKDEFSHMVDMESGTGVVHTAPGHGDVDSRIGKHYKLPDPSPIDEHGCLTTGPFKGTRAKQADTEIITKLKEENKLLHAGKVVHSYPLCWRCKTPLLYRKSRQWFLTLDSLRDKILKGNKKIKWLPEFAREMFNNVVEEAPDWAVTRQRFWGIPLPLWFCEKCEKEKIIGSVDELKKYATGLVGDDLHKNSVDKIKLKCDCGGEMVRDKDIMDVWFDSGIAAWASVGYPFKNKELFEKLWPVDLVDESSDQVRAWFYTLIVCAVATFDELPVATLCLNGWTLDDKGKKMSKSLGNVVFGEDAYNELGADLLRLYYCNDIAPWSTQKFSMKEAKELGRSLNILTNLYNYYKTYAKKSGKPAVEDKWLISRLNTLVKEVTDDMENFCFHNVGRKVIDFVVEDFSRTYIKLIRGREDTKKTFEIVLDTILRLLAPITPFITEYLYRNIFNVSVHLQKWPVAGKINRELEGKMEKTLEIVEKINKIRKDKNIKLRWPLKYAKVVDEIKGMDSVIEKMSNIKKVDVVTPDGKVQKIGIELDETIDEEEALLSELLRAIQAERKKKGLKVGEKIKLKLTEKIGDEKLIKERVDAESISYGECKNAVEIRGRKIGFEF